MSGEREIIGRQSSHFTRFVRMFALEIGVPCGFTPVPDLMARDAEVFAGNPALKLPVLRDAGDVIFGSLNICRVLAARSGNADRVFWPECAATPLCLNAHEILAHAMSAEGDVVVHEVVEARPPDNASGKRRDSLVNCLAWLDANLESALSCVSARDTSVFSLQLYCLVEHLPFRNPVDLAGMTALREFVSRFGERESARATPYRFDHA